MKLQLACLTLTAAAVLAGPAQSAVWSVRNRNDHGPGSLRQAIAAAHPGDTIVIRLTGPIRLSSELIIDKDLTIQSNAPRGSTLSGGGTTRILHVTPGVTALLQGLRLDGGSVAGESDASGGAVLNEGELQLTKCVISNSTSKSGAGGVDNTGTLILDSSALQQNRGAGCGGLWNRGVATFTKSTIAGNAADGTGGIQNDGVLEIDYSWVSKNSSFGDGAITNSGRLTVVNSTISENLGHRGTGGIGNNSANAELVITDSTLSGNTGEQNGGIFNAGQLTLGSSAVAANLATSGHGGLHNEGTAVVGNTIIAVNHVGTGDTAADPDVSGAMTSLGHNLVGAPQDATGFVDSDLLNVDPQLGPLQNNGGLTPTHALLAGSPAIDAGDNALLPSTLTFDQRGSGYPRMAIGSGLGVLSVDIGAVEYQGADLALALQAPRRVRLGVPFNLVLTVRNLGAEAAEQVAVTDALPAGLVFVRATCSSGTLTIPVPGDRGTVTAKFGLLQPGASIRITIAVRAVSAPATITNSAGLDSASFDPHRLNNDAQVVILTTCTHSAVLERGEPDTPTVAEHAP